MGTKYTIREMAQTEYSLLKEFLYEAIFQKEDSPLLPKSILKDPSLQVYIQNFGTEKDDICLCAELNKKIIGAVWVRNIEGFGSIDNETPEFAISLYKEFRQQGIGTALMTEMLALLKKKGYSKASLSVQKENYAFSMYENIGFQVVGETEEEYIMLYSF